MTDITELAQSLKAAAEKATPGQWVAFTHADSRTFSVHTPDDKRCGDVIKWAGFDGQRKAKANAEFIALANPANVKQLVEALEKAQQRIIQLESRTVTVHQSDYFASLVAMARISADKAMRKFPQPNYVLLKVAEEAGEVVQAGVHYAESRMEWKQVEGEIVQLLAMLIRLVTEGDEVNGVKPPASCAAGIKWEAE